MSILWQIILVAGVFLALYSFLSSLEDYEWNRKNKKFENWKDKWI